MKIKHNPYIIAGDKNLHFISSLKHKDIIDVSMFQEAIAATTGKYIYIADHKNRRRRFDKQAMLYYIRNNCLYGKAMIYLTDRFRLVVNYDGLESL